MNRKLFRIPSLFVGILLTVPLFAFAQNEDEDYTVTLSPFTIEEGDSVGHQATNTLAGSRLKTPLRDVGSAIQVITSQLFEDTGATTMEEILPYALNIESNGALGNFADGLLQGFTAGGGVRWQDRNAIGYPNIFSSDGQVIPDLASPFLGPEQLNGDIFFSYRRPIWDDKIDWKFQFNFRNAFGDNDPIPVAINPDGNIAVIRNSQQKTLFLTNTFSF